MSGKDQRLEKIIEASLTEAKKKAVGLSEPAKTEEISEETVVFEEEEKKPPVDKKKKVVKEETSAAASLHPAARAIPDPKALSSKTLMMNDMVQLMSGLNKNEMVDFFGKVMSQYGPGNSWGVGNNSEHNKSTIAMKPSDAMKEDIEDMFVGETLSEEFKEKATVLFEAAVNARVTVEMTQLEEQYAEVIQEEIKEFTENVTNKLDAYMDYVVENWMKDNEVAIESTLRNEIMEEFITGLKGLFAEHYIEAPESKVDVIGALAEKVDTLEKSLENTILENVKMKEIISDVAKKEIFESLSSNLTLSHQEKFLTLAEGIEFDGNLDTYENKLKIIKDSYFVNKKEKTTSNINEETFESGEEIVKTNTLVNRYVQAISNTVKK